MQLKGDDSLKKEKNKENKKRQGINWKKTIKNNAYALSFILKSAPSVLVVSLGMALIGAANTFLSSAYLYKYALNSLQEGAGIREILPMLIFIFLFSVTYQILQELSNYYCDLKNQKISAYINNMIYKKATEVELGCFENAKFYDSYVAASSHAVSCAFDVLGALSRFIFVVANVIAVGTLVISIDPIFVLLACVPLGATMISGKRRNNAYYNNYMESRRASRKKDYVRRTFYLSDFSKEMRLTRIYKVMYGRMSESVKELKVVSKKYGKKFMLFRFLSYSVHYIIVYFGSVLLAGYKTVVSGTMLIGDCFVVINSLTSVAENIDMVGKVTMNLYHNSMYIDNIRSFLEYESKIPDLEDAPEVPEFSDLEVKGLSFSYDQDGKKVLNDVSFKIGKGQRIAIVGHNGAGKSTLVKLLQRFYDPDEGEVLINGVNIKEYRLSSYRKLYGTVFQDYGLFAATVAENVMLRGGLNEDDKEIAKEALKKSDIWEKIESLPYGIDTPVTREFDSEGVVFSGGEAQKIAIARIHAMNSEIVIMDEPTSALDPIAEYKMYENMFAACENKTVIFISHRLSSATMADRIYLFEDGRICEEGSHTELLNMNGKYSEMWHKQADSYLEGEEADDDE